MKVIDIPFVNHTGITHITEEKLGLQCQENVTNHLGTLHAGALYTLGESQSGLFLQQLFPVLEGKVVPLLREGSMKYKKPVEDSVYAVADVSKEALERFEMMFARKGRGSITVEVLVQNRVGDICATGRFTWFVQTVK